MSPKVPRTYVLSYDLGGTKIAVGVVDSEGAIVEATREPVRTEEGLEAVLRQLSDLGRKLKAHHPEIRRAGIASAGPLDPLAGRLLNPTNLATGGSSWGVVELASIMERELGIPVTLENDAAAAVLAEHWVGVAKNYDNVMVLTLGTGLGTGIICNGELLRAGRNLHPEAGHVIINYRDDSAQCSCGNNGCAEAFLSGVHFTRRARAKLGRPELDTVAIAELARQGDRVAKEAFEEYAEAMSAALASYVAMFCPEIVVFTGGFAHASDLFLESTRSRLERRLVNRRQGIDLMPRLALSSLSNSAGLIGGGYVALRAAGHSFS